MRARPDTPRASARPCAPRAPVTLVLVLLAGIASLGNAECPNACSGHGECGRFDVCECWPRWQANDCSERVCPFAVAHVDSPKGDLDLSNTSSLSGPTETIIVGSQVFPQGTPRAASHDGRAPLRPSRARAPSRARFLGVRSLGVRSPRAPPRGAAPSPS